MDLVGINFSDLGPSSNLISINKKSWITERVPWESLSFDPGERWRACSEAWKPQCHRYAIAAMKLLPATIRTSVVGHLPWEISRFADCLIVDGGEYGATSPILMITTGSRQSRNSYTSSSCCAAGRKQCTCHERIRRVSEGDYKEPVNVGVGNILILVTNYGFVWQPVVRYIKTGLTGIPIVEFNTVKNDILTKYQYW